MLAVAATASGCRPSAQDLAAEFQNEDPAKRVDAIVIVGRTRDRAALPFLVDRLTDSEQDVRFFAILSLKRITGTDMGWRYYDPPEQRAEAVARWRKWLADQAATRRGKPAGPGKQRAGNQRAGKLQEAAHR